MKGKNLMQYFEKIILLIKTEGLLSSLSLLKFCLTRQIFLILVYMCVSEMTYLELFHYCIYLEIYSYMNLIDTMVNIWIKQVAQSTL